MTLKTLSNEQLLTIYLKAIKFKTDASFRTLLFEEILKRNIQHLIPVQFYMDFPKKTAT
ncbi:sporulation histidine kinase inhibitor Sda [Bacillus litorisediminis]|uniref:sporulation histidine kinase inhibitor Sda n=1 Tax=Bacillus litorisediminis TaxID=2922713 RepID=UPI0036F1A855